MGYWINGGKLDLGKLSPAKDANEKWHKEPHFDTGPSEQNKGGIMYRFHKIVLIISLVLTMAIGCAPKATQYSGFLQDYPQFVEGQKGVDKVYIKEGLRYL